MPPIVQDPAERVPSAGNADELARRAAEQLLTSLGAAVAYVGVARDDGLATLACLGATTDEEPVTALAHDVFMGGESVLRDDAGTPGLGSMAAVLLHDDGHAIGVLLVLADEVGGLDHRDLGALEVLAVSLGAAIGQSTRLKRLRAVLQAAPVGMLQVDRAGTIMKTNRRCRAMFGRTEDEFRAVTFWDVILSEDLPSQIERHDGLIAGTSEKHEFEQQYIHSDGSVFWGHTHVTLGAIDGEPAAVVTIQDITQRKLAHAALRAGRDRLEEIIAIQHEIAAADGDPDQVLAMIAERTVELAGADGSMVCIVEADELVVAAASGPVGLIVGHRRHHEGTIAEHAFAKGSALLIEDTSTDPRVNLDKERKAIQDKTGVTSLICVPLMARGKPAAVINVVRVAGSERFNEGDLQTLELVAVVLASAVSRAAELRARREQLEALARLEATYSSAPVGMTTITLDGTIVDVNPAMRTMLGAPGDTFAGRPIVSLAHADDAAMMTAELRRIATQDVDTVRFEHRLIGHDCEVIWVDAAWSVVRDADGARSFAIGTVLDITKRRAAEAVLREQAELNEYQALHDELTGLPNRTLFRDRAGRALESARRASNRLAVLVLDLDGFKQINDMFGHAAGDDVLVELSRRLDSVLRGSDTAARLGGDEFALLLPDVHIGNDVVPVVDRICRLFGEPIETQGNMVSITVSIGVSVYPDGGADIEALLRVADLAMYDAKRAKSGYVLTAGR